MKRVVVLASGQEGWCFPAGPASRVLVGDGGALSGTANHPQAAAICTLLSGLGVRPLSVDALESQECFVLVVMAEIADGMSLETLRTGLAAQGQAAGLTLRVQREDVFRAMHRI